MSCGEVVGEGRVMTSMADERGQTTLRKGVIDVKISKPIELEDAQGIRSLCLDGGYEADRLIG
jgi:hypothetical protein